MVVHGSSMRRRLVLPSSAALKTDLLPAATVNVTMFPRAALAVTAFNPHVGV